MTRNIATVTGGNLLTDDRLFGHLQLYVIFLDVSIYAKGFLLFSHALLLHYTLYPYTMTVVDFAAYWNHTLVGTLVCAVLLSHTSQ